MPVGTYGTVKAMTPEELEGMGAEIILGNTFHLWLRPGTDIISAHGDLHDFIHWQRPILTDSGGFQVYSLRQDAQDHRAGGCISVHRWMARGCSWGPEESMQIQRALGSDVVMIFDECTPYPATEREARDSMELSLRWAQPGRACRQPERAVRDRTGWVFTGLRERSLGGLTEIGFDGYAVGGLSVGEPADDRWRVLDFLSDRLPAGHPRYLMGLGRRRTSSGGAYGAGSTCSIA